MKCILNKSVSTNQGSVGDIIRFKIEVVNSSKINYSNVTVKDLLSSELKFIIGSICIDNREDSYSNILSGVNIGELDSFSSKSIYFDAEIIRNSKSSIYSEAVVEYSFRCGEVLKSGYSNSNLCEIYVKNPNISIIRKSNREDVLLDDIIEFNIKISNNGDLDILSIFLVEEIPSSIQLIDGTFSIDGTIINSVELGKGVMIEGIPFGGTKLISYNVKVSSSNSSSSITTSSKVKYSYILQNGLINYKESEKVYNSIRMAISSFKQVDMDDYLCLSCSKPDIDEINDLKANVEITSYNIIKTSIAKSSEGYILSGYKLIVHGVLNQVLEYVANDVIKSVHTDSFVTQFSSYIILPQDFNLINKISIESSIENIYYNKVDSRSLFRSINLLLLAKSSG